MKNTYGKFFTILLTSGIVLTSIFTIKSTKARDRVNYAKLKELSVDWDLLSENEIRELNLISNIHHKGLIHGQLAKAKEHLVAGDILRAKYYLTKVDDSDPVTRQIRRRYEAIIAFIDNNYTQALNILNYPQFNQIDSYPNICMLKLFTMLSTKVEVKKLKYEYKRCSQATEKFSNNEQMWLSNLIQFKLGNYFDIIGARKGDIQYILETNQKIKIWLKSGLYLNSDRILDKHMDDLPFLVYKSKGNRELLGLYHYRNNRLDEALEFLEDIHGPNAENIKGNIALKKKQYELAFGHFKLSLKKKNNSKFALMRSIPLAWTLGLWSDGIDLLKNFTESEFDDLKKITLDTAFRIQTKEYKRALGQIEMIDDKFDGNIPYKIHLMASYLGLILNKKDKIISSGEKACTLHDGLSCFLIHQTSLWENISLTAKRDEKTTSLEKFDPSKLKQKQEISSLDEMIFVDQRDIEELDSGVIKFKLLR